MRDIVDLWVNIEDEDFILEAEEIEEAMDKFDEQY
jgi:hypothetical protein